ncbi:hypothetical protein BSM4216_2799 [Bacillus smithii]|nr:hypothetical protein BSM4216_2799 [Bacillus smithii]
MAAVFSKRNNGLAYVEFFNTSSPIFLFTVCIVLKEKPVS